MDLTDAENLDFSQVKLLSTAMMLGILLGSIIGGRLGDRIGRKKSMFLAAAIILPSVILGGYTSSYIVFLMAKLLNSLALPMIWITFQASRSTSFRITFFSRTTYKSVLSSCFRPWL